MPSRPRCSLLSQTWDSHCPPSFPSRPAAVRSGVVCATAEPRGPWWHGRKQPHVRSPGHREEGVCGPDAAPKEPIGGQCTWATPVVAVLGVREDQASYWLLRLCTLCIRRALVKCSLRILRPMDRCVSVHLWCVCVNLPPLLSSTLYSPQSLHEQVVVADSVNQQATPVSPPTVGPGGTGER